jgi:hypothetical protein
MDKAHIHSLSCKKVFGTGQLEIHSSSTNYFFTVTKMTFGVGCMLWVNGLLLLWRQCRCCGYDIQSLCGNVTQLPQTRVMSSGNWSPYYIVPTRWGDCTYSVGISEWVCYEKCFHSTLFCSMVMVSGLHVHLIYPRMITFFEGTIKVKSIAVGLWPSRISSKEYGTKYEWSGKKYAESNEKPLR